MDIIWKYATPVQGNLVLKVAKDHAIELPEFLVKIIEKGNNGSPSKKLFYYDNNKNEDVFKTLLSYNRNDIENVYSALNTLKDYPALYPFGNDPAGNLICLENGKVVLWKHETLSIWPVSNTVEEFFHNLH